jgi:ribonuclease VapC
LVTWQKHGKQTAENRIDSVNNLALQRIESSPELALIAGEFKAKYRISFADAWIAAIAKHLGAILVHKDPEFEAVETELRVLKLPYKTPK